MKRFLAGLTVLLVLTAAAFAVTPVPRGSTSVALGTDNTIKFLHVDNAGALILSPQSTGIGGAGAGPFGSVAIAVDPSGNYAFLNVDANGALITTGAGSSGVTSVGLALPAELTISNSPVTTTGTLTGVWASQTQNKFFASPNGSSGTPAFRAMVAADVPTLNQNTTGTAADLSATLSVVHGGTGQVSYTDGQLLIGNTATGLLSKATLVQGANITITNGNGTITIASSAPGTGTVTSVSVATANGVSGSVATATTTPAITLTLGSITPSLTTTTLAIAANTKADGLVLANTTAAAASNQRYSPSVHWTGQGWKTTSTAASQAVDWISYVKPVQGTSTPTSLWNLESSINGGAFSSILTVSSAGLLAVPSISATTAITTPSMTISVSGGLSIFDAAGNTDSLTFDGTTAGRNYTFVMGDTNAVYTFPVSSGTLASLGANNAFSGNNTFTTQTQGDNSTKAATTAYVDAAITQFVLKDPVAAATTTALTFSPTYANGASGVGATLSGSIGVLIIDGYTPLLNDRLLIKNQASTFQNGIYAVTTLGTVSVGYVLTRTTDFNQAANILYGDSVGVLNGTTNANQQFTMNNQTAITVGTTAITFAQTSGGSQLTNGNGITITGNSIAINTGVTVDLNTAQVLTNKTLTTAVLGSSTFTTQSVRDNSTKGASTAYADRAALVGNASVSLGNLTGTINIDWSTGNTFRGTLTGNTTFTFSNATDGQTIVVDVAQTGTNTFTVTWPSAKWVGGTAPTMTTGAATDDITTFVDFNAVFKGNSVQNVK